MRFVLLLVILGIAQTVVTSTSSSTSTTTSSSTSTTSSSTSSTTQAEPTWTSPSVSGSAPSARYGHSAAMNTDGKMWVFDGSSKLADLYCLDTQTGTWTYPSLSGSAPAARWYHSAVMANGGKMWIFGGGGSSSSNIKNDVHYLDTQAGTPTWVSPTVSGSAPQARSGHSAVMATDGKMWIFGGYILYNSRLNDLHYLDTQADTPTWVSPSVSGSAPSKRNLHSAAIASDGKMWIFGGSTYNSCAHCILNDARYLDTQAATPTWVSPSVSGSAPAARFDHSAVIASDGKMWIFGGYDANGVLNDLHYLDTQADTPTWVSPSVGGSIPAARNGHSAVIASDDNIWLFGGRDSSNLDDVHYLNTEV
ncbi:unnamed protein product [Durusdinium trenchii]|uniref:Galactose oxidase n=1 Tax=Durusdinium trenchii TaxID=1381693 RepID=A0ABP0IGI3_9DINO